MPRLKTSRPTIYCDIMSIVAPWYKPILHAKTKHMQLDFFLC